MPGVVALLSPYRIDKLLQELQTLALKKVCSSQGATKIRRMVSRNPAELIKNGHVRSKANLLC